MRLLSIPNTVREIQRIDPDTAVTETMLRELIESKRIECILLSVHKKIDIDRLGIDLNNLLGLPGSSMPQIRSIQNTYRELTKRAMGISSGCIRENVKSGVIPSIHIGNRDYVALDYFESQENVYALFDHTTRLDVSKTVLRDAELQIDRLISDHFVMPSVQRKRKKQNKINNNMKEK